MLYKEHLEEIIFQRHNIIRADEIIVVSGYVGPKPIERLQTLPFRSTVVYGMYGSEGIKPFLHRSLTELQNTIDSVNIFYSNLPVHSKCYVWRYRGEIVHALVGSANFSVNGLTTPLREILAETTVDTFEPLNDYVQHVLNNSLSCLEVTVAERTRLTRTTQTNEICLMTLLDPATNEVQPISGLNWGQNPENNTRLNDASIPIRTSHIRNCADLFPPKQSYSLDTRGRLQRHNDSIEMIWDDGVSMEGLFEGSQPVDGLTYPKQVSSFPVKSQLGEYFRNRLGVPLGQPVRRHHLEAYGRTDVAVSLISEGVYKFDFSN